MERFIGMFIYSPDDERQNKQLSLCTACFLRPFSFRNDGTSDWGIGDVVVIVDTQDCDWVDYKDLKELHHAAS